MNSELANELVNAIDDFVQEKVASGIAFHKDCYDEGGGMAENNAMIKLQIVIEEIL